MKRSFILLFTMLLLISCNKENRKVATDDSGSTRAERAAIKQQNRQEEEQMRNDAYKLVKATCDARKARMESEEKPDNDFLRQKAKNLRDYKEDIATEMRDKYDQDPVKKEAFSKMIGEARLNVESCQGLERPQDGGQ